MASELALLKSRWVLNILSGVPWRRNCTRHT